MPAEEAAPELEIDLTKFVDVLLRLWWVIGLVLCLFISLAAAYIYRARPVFQAAALLLIEKEEKGGRAFNDATLTESKTDDYYQTQFRLIKSRTMLRKAYERAGLADVPEFAEPDGIDKLSAVVTVIPVKGSRLLNVSAESFDPQLAAKISNMVSEVYVSQNIENKLFISKEILQALGAGGSDRKNFEALPSVMTNPLVQQLKGNLVELESRWSDMSSRYTAQHPERVRLKSQIDGLRSLLAQETANVIESTKAQLSGQLLGNNVRIVDHAEPPKWPFKPQRSRILGLASLIGLFTGFLLAMTIDAMDQTIRSQEDVEKKLKLAFLGSVPRSESFEGTTVQQYSDLLVGPQSVTGESLKNIRTMIGFAAAGRKVKRILITSSTQGEGKTFMAINLALVFAQLGEKVLLIEGDLRRPNLHKRFGLSKAQGLSTFLAHAQSAEELSALIQDPRIPNLQVLVCGPIPPNPAELLSTPKLKALLSWAQDNFDHIIIDGTPVFPVTDALLWGKEVDAAVFVAQFSGVNTGLARKAAQKMQEGGMSMLGAVVNQVTWNARGYGGYYYHYYKYYAQEAKGS